MQKTEMMNMYLVKLAVRIAVFLAVLGADLCTPPGTLLRRQQHAPAVRPLQRQNLSGKKKTGKKITV